MKGKSINDERGSLHIIFVIIAIIAVIGSLGFVFWNNFLGKSQVTEQKITPPSSKKFCLKDENLTASKGVFCSEEIGIKFTIPNFFAGKLRQVDNFEVFQGGLDYHARESAGFSEKTYSANISGNDHFTLTIAREPLRTGYLNVGHANTNTYYDQDTGDLTLVKYPSITYDSTTETTTLSGSYEKADVVPSFYVSSVRIFKGTIGDAGVLQNNYIGVIKNKLVTISLMHDGYMGDPANDPTTIDANKVFEDFDKSIKNIKIIKE